MSKGIQYDDFARLSRAIGLHLTDDDTSAGTGSQARSKRKSSASRSSSSDQRSYRTDYRPRPRNVISYNLTY